MVYRQRFGQILSSGALEKYIVKNDNKTPFSNASFKFQDHPDLSKDSVTTIIKLIKQLCSSGEPESKPLKFKSSPPFCIQILFP